jgi:hypothetical protein
MPRAGFEPAIPMFERPKTVPALDGAARRDDDYEKSRDKEAMGLY